MNESVAQRINVGVDTGKDFLDIHARPLNEYFRVSFDSKGITEAVKRLRKLSPERVVIEATGRYEAAFIAACAKANLPFCVVNPIHVKRFAGAIGRKAKTDKLDAELIAHYSEVIRPALSSLKPDAIRLMADLVSRRNQLMAMQTSEKNRLQIMPKVTQASIKSVLLTIKKQIQKMDDELVRIPIYLNTHSGFI